VQHRQFVAACQQTEQDAVVAQLIKGYSFCMSQDRQLMQIQKFVLGPKFGAHIVEKSNDQGLHTVFMSPRTSCLRQMTSCTVLIDKAKHFNFCCIICEFLLFY